MGESSIDGVLREVKEEVGLDLKPETGKLLFTKRSFSMCLSARQLREEWEREIYCLECRP